MWLALLPAALAGDGPTAVIVAPGRHDDASTVAPVRDGDHWLALRSDDGGWRLVDTSVRLRATRPTSPFDATEAYYDVIVEPEAEGALLLVRAEGLRAGRVHAYEALPTFGAPAVWPAPDGTLVTVGLFGRTEPHPARYATPLWRDVTLQISPGRGEPWQVVVGPVDHHESPPGVLWAGDLDRDGRIDLITVTPGGGGGSTTELWLSSAAAPGRAVGLAATSVNEGC